jgi:cytochrome c553
MERPVLPGVAIFALLLVSATWGAEPSPAEAEFFEKHVRPLLAAHCFECHSEENAESGLRLDSLSGMLRGGERGPALVSGQPEASLIVSALNHGEVLQMPPKAKLAPQQIAHVVEWIQRGAAWPGESAPTVSPVGTSPLGTITAEDRQFWSFQPPQAPPLPEVQQAGWAQTPIDRFILAELEKKGLSPAPPADKRTLIRRVTFDLTGLPPTSEAIEEFLTDDSPQAFARVVDRLLGSPQYGERWGRHWLDVARYADSNGMDENLAFASAYRYRDYVIEAFNRDKPYDRFIAEQIAGDLLPAEPNETDEQRRERLTATGFLAIGPKMLADDDPQKKEMDIIDEQLDTLGKALLGLTIGCARCHDHKFDPIPAADYYSLAGVLKSTKTMENFKVVAEWHEHSLENAEQQAARAAHEQLIQQVQQRIEERQKQYPGSEATKQAVAALEVEKKALEGQRSPLDTAMGVTEGSPQNLRIHLRGSHTTLGAEVPRRFLRVIAGEESASLDGGGSGRLALAQWLAQRDHPLTSRVMVNRVWRWHFGRGIVPTIDNFGRLGERPTHPQLLDFLATEYVRRGWSTKALHRLILLSSTYQMSTRPNDAALLADPANKLYWRFNRRRLEAEEVRDAVLAVGGRLDLTPGGSLSVFANREYVTNRDRMAQGYANTRRSVYLPVYRSAVYDVLQAFDFADPSTLEGNRATTTVTPQALFIMNSDLVAASAASLAERVQTQHPGDTTAQLAAAFRSVLGRPPSAAEQSQFQSHLELLTVEYGAANTPPETARNNAWRSLCRVLLGSNEFMYVE